MDEKILEKLEIVENLLADVAVKLDMLENKLDSVEAAVVIFSAGT